MKPFHNLWPDYREEEFKQDYDFTVYVHPLTQQALLPHMAGSTTAANDQKVLTESCKMLARMTRDHFSSKASAPFAIYGLSGVS